jgi:hypothetical protein
MGDRIIITDEDDKPKPPPEIVVVAPREAPKTETVTEKTTVVETTKH